MVIKYLVGESTKVRIWYCKTEKGAEAIHTAYLNGWLVISVKVG